jgi:hypothetical protein
MLINNARLKAMVHYFDIAQVSDDKGKKYWVAWYFESLTGNDPLLKEGT